MYVLYMIRDTIHYTAQVTFIPGTRLVQKSLISFFNFGKERVHLCITRPFLGEPGLISVGIKFLRHSQVHFPHPTLARGLSLAGALGTIPYILNMHSAHGGTETKIILPLLLGLCNIFDWCDRSLL